MEWVQTSDNIYLAVYDIAPENKKIIVMVHGWPLDHHLFEYQINELPTQGYRLILLDLRGFGASDRPWDGYNYDRLAEDLYTVIGAKKIDNFYLLGFSMGGAIVSRYMKNYQGKGVKKLILSSAAVPHFTQNQQYPYAAYTKEEIQQLIKDFLQDRPATLQQFGKDFFFQQKSTAFLEWFQDLTEQQSSYATIKTLISLCDEDLTEDLCSIQVPTGIFHGAQDKICPLPLAIATSHLIPQAELHIFECGGHGVFLEEIEKYNQELIAFLEK